MMKAIARQHNWNHVDENSQEGEEQLQKAVKKQAPNKQRILLAASEVFLATGYEKTSTAEIARLAKVSKRELYLHFADKRALLAAVVDELQQDMQGRMDNSWSSGGTLEEVLLQSAKAIQGFILSERFGKLVRIVAAESYHSPYIAMRFYQLGPAAGREATARYLKDQMAKGLLRTAPARKAADDFLDLVVGAQLMTAVILGQHDPSPPKPADTRHAVEVFLMIYRPDSSAAMRKRRPRSLR